MTDPIWQRNETGARQIQGCPELGFTDDKPLDCLA
jgi:hypothetical protein